MKQCLKSPFPRCRLHLKFSLIKETLLPRGGALWNFYLRSWKWRLVFPVSHRRESRCGDNGFWRPSDKFTLFCVYESPISLWFVLFLGMKKMSKGHGGCAQQKACFACWNLISPNFTKTESKEATSYQN